MNMNHSRNVLLARSVSLTPSRGFTIVELLVVIVVIAILASVSIVAYNGIQDRAQSAKAASAFDTYIQVLQMYYLDHGTYPSSMDGGGYMACLGEVSDYPADSTFAAGECYGPPDGSGKGTANNARVNSALNEALKSYAGSLPDGSIPKVTNGYMSRGLIYQSSYEQNASILYFLKGNGLSCGNGKAMSSGSLTTCYINLANGAIST